MNWLAAGTFSRPATLLPPGRGPARPRDSGESASSASPGSMSYGEDPGGLDFDRRKRSEFLAARGADLVAAEYADQGNLTRFILNQDPFLDNERQSMV